MDWGLPYAPHSRLLAGITIALILCTSHLLGPTGQDLCLVLRAYTGRRPVRKQAHPDSLFPTRSDSDGKTLDWGLMH